jgi:hypothetical protein
MELLLDFRDAPTQLIDLSPFLARNIILWHEYVLAASVHTKVGQGPGHEV